MGRIKREIVAHEDVTQVGQDQVREFSSTESAQLNHPVIEPVPGPRINEKIEAAAFDASPVTIVVHESTNDNDDSVVETWVNGRAQRFIRGQHQTVKRMYVEALARTKKTGYGQEKFVDQAGFDSYRYPSRTALRYPFSLIEDRHPKGGQPWLQKILAEA